MSALIGFFGILFEPDESACFAKTCKGTAVYSIAKAADAASWANFFSINALSTTDNCASKEYHHVLVARRADGNVVSYRNILIELDKGSIEEQRVLIEASGLPYSTCTFSGKKSLHYIISLEQPLKNRGEYDVLVKQVQMAVGPDKIDTSTKNPSRLSRLPTAIRADTILEQSLMETKARVPNERLVHWVASKIGQQPTKKSTTKRVTIQNGMRSLHKPKLSKQTQKFLTGQFDVWTPSLFRAGCELCRMSVPIEDAERYIGAVAPFGYLDAHDFKQIQNAYKLVEKGL